MACRGALDGWTPSVGAEGGAAGGRKSGIAATAHGRHCQGNAASKAECTAWAGYVTRVTVDVQHDTPPLPGRGSFEGERHESSRQAQRSTFTQQHLTLLPCIHLLCPFAVAQDLVSVFSSSLLLLPSLPQTSLIPLSWPVPFVPAPPERPAIVRGSERSRRHVVGGAPCCALPRGRRLVAASALAEGHSTHQLFAMSAAFSPSASGSRGRAVRRCSATAAALLLLLLAAAAGAETPDAPVRARLLGLEAAGSHRGLPGRKRKAQGNVLGLCSPPCACLRACAPLLCSMR